MMQQAARCYHRAELHTVQRNLQDFLDRWRTVEPAALRAFATDLHPTLSSLRLPPGGHRCLHTPNYLERLFRTLRQRTKLIGSFEQPVHLEQMLLGILLQSQSIQLPIQLQPLFNPDTII